jgi:hypothetical protein
MSKGYLNGKESIAIALSSTLQSDVDNVAATSFDWIRLKAISEVYGDEQTFAIPRNTTKG